jgi:hypothetical protein
MDFLDMETGNVLVPTYSTVERQASLLAAPGRIHYIVTHIGIGTYVDYAISI